MKAGVVETEHRHVMSFRRKPAERPNSQLTCTTARSYFDLSTRLESGHWESCVFGRPIG